MSLIYFLKTKQIKKLQKITKVFNMGFSKCSYLSNEFYYHNILHMYVMVIKFILFQLKDFDSN